MLPQLPCSGFKKIINRNSGTRFKIKTAKVIGWKEISVCELCTWPPTAVSWALSGTSDVSMGFPDPCRDAPFGDTPWLWVADRAEKDPSNSTDGHEHEDPGMGKELHQAGSYQNISWLQVFVYCKNILKQHCRGLSMKSSEKRSKYC